MNEELLNKYDEVMGILMVNIYTLSKESDKIILTNLNRKDKEHLLVLRAALMAKDIYNRPLYLNTNLWNWFVLNWRMRKLTRRVPRTDETNNVIEVPKILEFMRQPLIEYLGEDFNFTKVYDAFYKGELD